MGDAAMTLAEFAARPACAGRSIRFLRNLCLRGMPHARRPSANGGPPVYVIEDAAAAESWLRANVMDAAVNPKTRGGRPRHAAAPSARSVRSVSEAARRLADAAGDGDDAPLAEMFGPFGSRDEHGRIRLDLSKLMQLEPTRVAQLKYALESMLRKVELDREEGRLADAAEVRRTWIGAVESLKRGLQAASRTAAAKARTALKLDDAAYDALRRIIEDEVDQACLRLSADADDGD